MSILLLADYRRCVITAASADYWGPVRGVDVAAYGVEGVPDMRVRLRGLMHHDDCTVQAGALS